MNCSWSPIRILMSMVASISHLFCVTPKVLYLVFSCISEMLVVEELYKEAVENTARKLIIFNGELDRIRSGCILCQFYMVLMHIILNVVSGIG